MTATANDVRADLLELLGDQWRVSSSESTLALHGEAMIYHPAHDPGVFVFPQTTDEVSRVLAYANERRIPVTAFGMGASAEGQIISIQDCLDSEVASAVEPELIVHTEPAGDGTLAITYDFATARTPAIA